MKYRNTALLLFVFVILTGMGCGRKLPPLPPGPADPVEIVSIDFQKDGTVEARARVNIEGAKVTLLGKPKGICPLCTDDLEKKDDRTLETTGVIVMRDMQPEAEYMVYRFSFEKGTTTFLTPPRVVRK